MPEGNSVCLRCVFGVHVYVACLPGAAQEFMCKTYLNVPPFASTSSPSSGSAEHLPFPPMPPLASLKPSFAKLPTCGFDVRNMSGGGVRE